MPSPKYNPSDYITPININHLEGRVMFIPAVKKNSKNEILFVYDLNSNLEKYWGLAFELRKYGNVTVVDLPGFGGMDAFSKIGMRPSLNNYADYLASYIKLKYRRKKLQIFAVGIGSVISIRMLQRNIALRDIVKSVIFIDGYAHRDDFKEEFRKNSYLADKIKAYKFISLVNDKVYKNKYYLNKQRIKIDTADIETLFKLDLMKEMDTHSVNNLKLIRYSLDNCKEKLNIKLLNVHLPDGHGQYEPKIVNEHFKIITKNYSSHTLSPKTKIPEIFKDNKQAKLFINAKVVKFINSTR